MRLHRLLAAGCGAAALAVAAAPPPAATASSGPSAPVIHERFTLLPCPHRPRTTLQLEGCAEHRVLARDHAIDALNAKVDAKLRGTARAQFAAAAASWLSYRNGTCTAEASIYAGGSVQPIAYANCLASIDSSHIGELRLVLRALSPAG